MPSLIYIARIRNLSEELVQSLRSAGCHVESFKSGEITQDECLLAMTPEAAEAALRPKRAATEDGSSRANLPAAAISRQPGRDTAVWDGLKTAIAKELCVDREPPAPVASAVEPTKEFASNAKAVGPAGSNPEGKVNQQHAPIEPSPIVAASSPAAGSEPGKTRPDLERCYRVLRNPLSTVAAVLVFAVAYRGLPSITASGRTTSQSGPGLALSVEASSGTMRKAQRHLSPDGVVAEDFTRRVIMPASNSAARKNVDLKQSQKVSTQKRIVMD
jgi:hypothetical protein